MHSKPFSVIANKTAHLKDVRTAIANAGPTTESPTFWTGIANDVRYSIPHRQLCISALFHRHVKAGMRLAELKTSLHNSKWLKEEYVSEFRAVTGTIPFPYEPGVFSVFSFVILPQAQEDADAVYVKIRGDIRGKDLFNYLLTEQDDSNIANAVIHAIDYGNN
ncbi:MAG: hypothetical protein EBS84_20190 [Proteobacteria bacterium]|nr:hypothetical protein [Verrucomicrobiota bacterium]NBU11301.1 hypothetical protein [Pseudomonadota bacterium]